MLHSTLWIKMVGELEQRMLSLEFGVAVQRYVARCASVDVPLHPVVPRAVDLIQGAVGMR